MIRVRSTLQSVVGSLESGLLNSAVLSDRVLRVAASDAIVLIQQRVHFEGANAEGKPFGTYSPEYLKERQRPPYNRTPDSKVVLSLTRQLESSFTLVANGASQWDVGFTDGSEVVSLEGKSELSSDQKARVLERRYGPTFSLSEVEADTVAEAIVDYLTELL